MKLKPATAKRRLEILANFLTDMPDNLIINMRTILEPLPCGTAGCAMGYATMIPEFQACGLKLAYKHRDARTNTFSNMSYVEVGAKFFGISERTANYLFSAEKYNNPHDRYAVVARILSVANKMRVS